MFYIKNIKINSTAVIFIIIAIWYAVTNLLWWTINAPTIPYHDSEAVHFLYIFDIHKSNNPLIIWIFEFFLSVFGKENFTFITIVINYVFFLIPLYFIYKIGKKIDSKETGNIAMILFALVPAVYGLSRQFGHKDYHLIAAMAVNVYCLLNTDFFKNKKWSILYGISAGIGLLIKDTILIFLIPTFFWAVMISVREKFDIQKVLNILQALISGIIVAGWLCLKEQAIKKVIFDPITLVAPIFSIESVRIMTMGLYEELLSPPLFFVFILGLFYFIKEYHNKNKSLFLLWIIIPWLIIFFMPHYKLSEYFTGFIPSVVIISAIYITHIKKYSTKAMLLIFLIVIGTVQYINFSYFSDDLFSRMRIKISGFDIMYYNTATENIMTYAVRNRSEQIIKIVKKIKKIYPASKYAVYVTMQSPINNKVFRACMLLNDMQCDVRNIEVFDIQQSDEAVIIVGKFSGINALQRREIMLGNHPKLVYDLKDNNTNVEQYLGQYSEELRSQIEIMNRDFEPVTTFYFKDIVNANNAISLFKRKK